MPELFLSGMCGIVGYVGRKEAQPILLNCLSRLEYRGYDSCGIAVCGSRIEAYKDEGRVEVLHKKAPSLRGTLGIGHTRWATHGLPTAINAHPHFDCSGKVALVHNGIVSNYLTLRRQLTGEGHNFVSETDTEIIPHLIEKHYEGDLRKAVEIAVSELEGSFAIAVLMEGQDRLVVSRKDSPLVIGVGDGENFVASDVAAILDYTNRVIYLEDGDIAIVLKDNVEVTRNQTVVNREEHRILWDREDIKKNGYDHFMLKEIHEQPRVIRDSLNAYPLTEPGLNSGFMLDSSLRDLLILGCGTSYHAGLIGKYVIEELLGIPVRVELGSEFNHRERTIVSSAAIAITQSGETADVLAPLKKIRHAQPKTLVITNVPNSTATRLADSVIYTQAGPEIGVAATKSFIAQLLELYKLALSSNLVHGEVSKTLNKELRLLPSKVEQVLENEQQIVDCATYLSQYDTVFYIGRGIDFPVALEGALKLKEISYIHAEAYPAGELKHGPLALLGDKTPVIAIVTQGSTHSSMVSNIKEIGARQSPVIAVADEADEGIETLVDMVVRVPHVSSIFSPVVNVVTLQLIAYHTARCRGCPIDYPRNLAKSVTVE